MKIKRTSFAVAPEGSHAARCYRVVDLGTHSSVIKGKTKVQHKILMSFELPNEKHEFDPEKGLEPFSVHTRLTASLDTRATLFKILRAWKGSDFTPQQLDEFKVESVIGRPCLLGVIHKTDEGDTYANIDSVMALPKGMECPPAINPPLFFSLDPDDFERLGMRKVFEALGDGIKDVIRRSPEWQKLTGEAAPSADGEVSDSKSNEGAAAAGKGEIPW